MGGIINVLQCHCGLLLCTARCLWDTTETFMEIDKAVELKYTFSLDNWVAFQVANLPLHSNTNHFSLLTAKSTLLSEQ